MRAILHCVENTHSCVTLLPRFEDTFWVEGSLRRHRACEDKTRLPVNALQGHPWINQHVSEQKEVEGTGFGEKGQQPWVCIRMQRSRILFLKKNQMCFRKKSLVAAWRVDHRVTSAGTTAIA